MAYQSLFFWIAVGGAGMIAFRFVVFAGTAFAASERLRAFLIGGPVILVLGLLSALHAKGALDYAWLYGSEASDIGPVELGTAAFFAGAAVFAALVAREARSVNRFIFAGLALACLFIAGQEVSWGQWLFQQETPPELADVNLQNETDLQSLIEPRGFDLFYCVAGFMLIRPVRNGVAVLAVGNSIFRDIRRFLSWVRYSRFGMLLTLSTAVFLQHKSFEAYSELLLSLTLFFFLLHMLGELQQHVFLERRLDMKFTI